MKKILCESISQDQKDKTVIRSGQHEFMMGRSCLTNMVAISNNATSLLVRTREMGFVYLDFRKGFDTVSCNIITDKLTKYRVDK